MQDQQSSGGTGTAAPSRQDQASGSPILQLLRKFVFRNEDQSLREQLEEVIELHEDNDIETTEDLSSVEREMLRAVLRFSEQDVDDIMVPRGDIKAIEKSAPFSDYIAIFAEHGHSRIPVYEDNLDNIAGMVHIRDIFAVLAKGGPPPENIDPFLREPLIVPESMGVIDLLADMRKKRTHLAIVIDEYSGTEGLVTIEDIVEEIVGDIKDEHDEEEQDAQIIQLPNGVWEVDARAELDDIGDLIDERLADIDDDIDTIGGLAFVLAGHIPVAGERLDHESGWQIEIMRADDRRVHLLQLHPPKDGQIAQDD